MNAILPRRAVAVCIYKICHYGRGRINVQSAGLVMDRDKNSEVNILTSFLAQLGPHTQIECSVLQNDSPDVASMRTGQCRAAKDLECAAG